MSDVSMSPALAVPPAPAEPLLAYPDDEDDDSATRNESPPVTTPADHPELRTASKAPDAAQLSPHPDAIPLADAAMPSPPHSPQSLHIVSTDAPVDNGHVTPPADAVPVLAPTSPAPKRELPADEDTHVAKRARSEASGSGPVTSIPAPNPLAAYTSVQDPPPPPYTGPTLISANQHKFCLSTVRSLKRIKDATPFLRPVDPVALGIPHYPIVVKRPMDFNTVETKLMNSNPSKPCTDPLAPRYRTTDDFVADTRQIFQNCYLFNGPEHFISQQARRVEDVLDRQLKQMPTDEEVKPVVRYDSPPPIKKSSVPPARRQSTSVPTIRRNTPNEFPSPVARPKREIHPPPPKDLPYSDLPVNGKRARKSKSHGPERDDGTAEQLRYCMKILTDFNKKSLYQTASPFYEPVDPAYVPNYYSIVKRPMDLATMRNKLDKGEYPNAQAFNNDFRLMMKNCQNFNPPGTAVHTAGQEMDRIFREKWKNLPALRQLSPEDEGADSSEDEHAGEDIDLTISMLETEIENLKDRLALLKAKQKSQKLKQAAVVAPPPKERKSSGLPPKKPLKKASSSYAPPQPAPAPGPSRSKPAPPPKPAKNGSTKPKNKNGAGSDTERSISTMSFEQKKELSTTIESLDGDKLEKVIQIIYEGMPDLQNSNEEIELDIESLSPAVLNKLWNFVVKPQLQKKSVVSASGPKRTSGNASKGAAATGGVKRKSMDEDVESERIRKLQAQIDRFGKPQGAKGGFEHNGFDDDAHSSNASGSESDSSDSD